MTHAKIVSFVFLCCAGLTAPFAMGAEEANEAAEPSVKGSGSIDLLAGEARHGWKAPPPHWQLNEGKLVGDTGPEKINVPEWIYTQQRFSDFVFTCEMKLSGDKKRNTGIYFRVNTFPFKRGNTSYEAPSGYEFDAAFHAPGKKNYRGSLGDWYARPKLRILPDPLVIEHAYKEDDWNRMTIRARGNRLEYWINSIKIMDFVDPDPKGSREGHIGFQIHDGSIMNVEYRAIHVRPL